MKTYRNMFLALACVTFFGCDDLEPEGGPDNDPGTEIDGEIRTTLIDATAEDAWIHFDLDAAKETDDPSTWDLAFQRMWIASNGGAGVEVTHLNDVSLEDVEAAPADGYRLDPETLDETTKPTLAFHGDSEWYAYNPQTHQLSPVERVYVVRSTDGQAFAIQVRDYYDDAGTSGFVTFQWKEIER